MLFLLLLLSIVYVDSLKDRLVLLRTLRSQQAKVELQQFIATENLHADLFIEKGGCDLGTFWITTKLGFLLLLLLTLEETLNCIY